MEVKKSKKRYHISKSFNLEEESTHKSKEIQRKRFNLTYLNLGFYLIIPLLLGVFIGINIDNKFKTRPVFTGIFIFLGMIGTFYNLYKIARDE